MGRGLRTTALNECAGSYQIHFINKKFVWDGYLIVEIDQYIGLPIFKHFTIIGFVKKNKKNNQFRFFYIYIYLYLYIYIYIYIYLYLYLYLYLYISIYIYIYIYISIYLYIYIY